MVSSSVLVIAWCINLVWWTILFRIAVVKIVQKRRRIAAKNAPKPISYYKIARLEIEIFGETKPNVDSFIAAGCRSEAEIHGIDETGHMKNGSCNLNSSLGPACSKMSHYRKRNRSSLAVNTVRTAINPYADQEYDDPFFIDEDGRPW